MREISCVTSTTSTTETTSSQPLRYYISDEVEWNKLGYAARFFCTYFLTDVDASVSSKNKILLSIYSGLISHEKDVMISFNLFITFFLCFIHNLPLYVSYSAQTVVSMMRLYGWVKLLLVALTNKLQLTVICRIIAKEETLTRQNSSENGRNRNKECFHPLSSLS